MQTLSKLAAFAALPILASTTAAVAPAHAHGDHRGGGGIVLPAGVTLVSVEYDVLSYKPLTDERLLAAAPGPHALSRIAVPVASIAYGLTRDLTIAARLPYLANRKMKELSEDGDIVDRGGVYGLGDASFTGTWRFFRDEHRGFEASAIAGVKAPTGRTDALDRFGERFETHHQPGSGAWDGIAGAGVSQQVGRWLFGANMLYTRVGRGSQDTTVGDRMAYGVTATYRLWATSAGAGHAHGHDHDHAMHLGGKLDGMMRHGGVDHHEPAPGSGHDVTLDVSLGLNRQWSEQVRVSGVADPDTGGTVTLVTPGIRLGLDSWAVYANFGIPVAKDLNGLQSEPRWDLAAGIAVKF